ncbi:MAG: SusC/RagA family TonB-linked outer membrane protein [Candidatus Cyclobacteriaceae bacterium M3_2C_046]
MKKKLHLGLLLGILLVWAQAFGQERTVTGQVTSVEDEEALPGVNVLLKGTTAGTVTDINGEYRISVPSTGGTLVFSFIGYQTVEQEIGNRSQVNLAMRSDVKQLGEVVITAAGIQRESRNLGYNVEYVESEKVQQVGEPDPLRALQGKVPGLNISSSTGAPGSATRITIRGVSSFFGNNEPLFVVDGTPYYAEQFTSYNQLTGGASYATPLSALDPNAIESITVLKGGAAASLYGSRAANGVIVITTKQGSAKPSNKGMEVTFNTSYSIEEIANLPEYQNTYGNGTEFQYRNSNGSWGPRFSQIDSVASWPQYQNAGILGAKIPYVPRPDNVKDLFRQGHVIDNSLSLNGGNETSSFNVTASNLLNEGYIPNSKFERTSVGVGGRFNLENGVQIGGNLTYALSKQNGPLFGESGAQDPAAASSFARTLWLGRTWDTSLPYEDKDGNPLFFVNGVDHPLWSWHNNGVSSNLERVTANVTLGYDILDWLRFDFRGGVNQFSDRRQQIWNIGSAGYSGVGAILDDDINFQEIEINALLTVNRSLSEKFNFTGIAGYNINQRTQDRQSVLGNTIIAPGIFDIDNTSTLVPFGGTYERRRLLGTYADVTVGYADYLYLNLTGRSDWSSTLPEENNNYLYGSSSVSFIFTEPLNLSGNVLNEGKLRASVARVGNDADPYQTINLFNVNMGANTNLIGALRENDYPFRGVSATTRDVVAYDPDLSPEFTTEYELGTELVFFTNRINLDFTYYYRKTTDIIANISLPNSSGYEQFLTNIGEMENRGIEIGLGITPLDLPNGFNWNIFTTYTQNRNKVLSLVDGVERINVRNLFGGGITPVIEPGQPYGILRGSYAARDEEGNYLIDPADGMLIEAPTFKKIGDPNPDFLLGLTNTFSFKGFTLNVLMDYRHGGDIYSTTVERLLGRGVTKDTENREASRIIPGYFGDVNTGLPLLDENGNKIPNTIQVSTNDLYFQNGAGSFAINAEDDATVYDGTVVRLREISLGYQLPKNLLERTPFGTARLTLLGRNLWYNAPNVPEFTNFDPEVNGFGSTNTQGLDYASAPTSRRYGVNLMFTF